MLNTLLAQVAPAPQPTSSDAMVNLLTLGLLFAGMYFLVIAPQKQKQKEQDKLLKGLQKGDEVLTVGGLYGVIQSVGEERVSLKLADKVIVEVQLASIINKVVTEKKA